jgi:hypothetical protein
MIESDTVKLLRECDAGVKMGIASIGDVLGAVRSAELKHMLEDSQSGHLRLGEEIEGALRRYGDDGKKPNPVAKSMSSIKTGVKLALEESDHTVADLMTDGCNMGVKSLSRYLNQYKAADEDSKDICRRLIREEERLAVNMRGYL